MADGGARDDAEPVENSQRRHARADDRGLDDRRVDHPIGSGVDAEIEIRSRGEAPRNCATVGSSPRSLAREQEADARALRARAQEDPRPGIDMKGRVGVVGTRR